MTPPAPPLGQEQAHTVATSGIRQTFTVFIGRPCPLPVYHCLGSPRLHGLVVRWSAHAFLLQVRGAPQPKDCKDQGTISAAASDT